MTPAEAERAAVSSVRRAKFSATLRTASRFSEGDGWALETTGAVLRWEGADSAPTDDDFAAGIAAVRAYCAPIDSTLLIALLGELAAVTARRKSDDAEADKIALGALAKRVAPYPEDAVRAALWPQKPWKFWPTWAELHAIVESATAGRRMMLEALAARRARIASPDGGDGREHVPDEVRYAQASEAQTIASRMRGRQPARPKAAAPMRDERTMTADQRSQLWEDRLRSTERSVERVSRDVQLAQLAHCERYHPHLITPSRSRRLADLRAWAENLG